jgi:hypothetical protein
VAKEVFALSGFKNTQNWFKNDMNIDAEIVARNENRAMQQGQMVQVQQGEDSEAHLRVHQAEELQYRSIKDKPPWLTLLTQHIEETKFAMQQKNMAAMAAMMGQMGGAPGQPATAGMESGGEIAAAQGAMANPAGLQ